MPLAAQWSRELDGHGVEHAALIASIPGDADSVIAAVRKFADANHLAIVEEHPARRTVVLSGTVAEFNHAFGVDLQDRKSVVSGKSVGEEW